MKASMRMTKATMLQYTKELEKLLEEYTKPIKPTKYVDYEKSLGKSYENTAKENNDRKILEDRETGHSTEQTSKERTDGIRPEQPKAPAQIRTPSQAMLICFISEVTYNNFEDKFTLPKQFTRAGFYKLINAMKTANRTVRPGKPTKPAQDAAQDTWDSYYADCNAFYLRRTQAINKLCKTYPAHAAYIRNALKK